VTGFVHCDPHPGNIFVRKVGNTDQVVLIDFGLCLRLSNEFRLQYAKFWQALFLQDKETISSIVKEWGIGN
jgi:aarF domain-containing kinase